MTTSEVKEKMIYLLSFVISRFVYFEGIVGGEELLRTTGTTVASRLNMLSLNMVSEVGRFCLVLTLYTLPEPTTKADHQGLNGVCRKNT